MVYCKRGWMGLVIVALLVAAQGCNSESDHASGDQKPKLSSSKLARPADKANAAAKDAVAKTAPARVEEPPPKPTIPHVALSDELLATCRVKVGDRMPVVELPEPGGKPQPISALWGKRLTVVFFWTAQNPYSLGEVEDLNDDVAKAFADRGVKVVGVNHGDSPTTVREKAKSAGLVFPVVMDPKGEYFGKVAREKVLRTYLLDADGKILWFDVEYSRSTRRDLLQAIDVALDSTR